MGNLFPMLDAMLCSFVNLMVNKIPDDFEKFLDYAQQLEVTLTSEAQRLIQRYYIASRRVRAFDDSSSSMPRTAVKTLLVG